MRVIATAGHVDHGKSTLVRALTGTDPDRWAAEHERGLTIDLGYAHTTLPSGETVAFVDVPGHQRFIANMLAGIGPVPIVLFVVAADEGWRAQSSEHLAAIAALGIRHGLLVLTRNDLADPEPAREQARARLSEAGFGDWADVAVSARSGDGLSQLRAALDALLATVPAPEVSGRGRLWVDRSFTIRGAGTVVTGTLGSGTLAIEDRVRLAGRPVRIRGLQSLGEPVERAAAVARVAVNLRGLDADRVGRGDALTTGDWWTTDTVDGRVGADDLPERLMLHVGTFSGPVRVRRLGHGAVRLTWSGELPLQVGDRMVLRDPGRQQVLAGATVLDLDPPPLRRRGAARERAESLSTAPTTIDADRELARRGVTDGATLRALGADPDRLDAAVVRAGRWLIDPVRWAAWVDRLPGLVRAYAAKNPMQARMPAGTAATALGLPSAELLAPLADQCGLITADGQLAEPGARADLGPAEDALREVERSLAERPFAAPERDELTRLGLGSREIATAVRLGRLIDLGELVVLAPAAPALAMRELARLPQPFTTSQARQALGSTRRVVIPLLEHLDARGWTRRLDGGHREVRR
ncbi:selenocysteine-specific translation elongation factor [Enemella dayhoffiae]|uniref:Selenocysteine-specific translation elongation factor n=1 Tax=Enemella dayhoffiae TaxID=2016507 RepID=A0A255GYV6_9ACTN|nr:selenocysteine-specific translation elongation factor [Enemella dayhoffiae]OYO20770.1 selenocysteine-specific translation elongation factor [Enemella dayhoffiae]